MASMIQVRVEDELKQQADMLFKDLGTDTTTAIRMFLKQAVCHDGFPFEIKRNSNYRNPYIPISEDEMLAKLEKSQIHAGQGKYRDADDVISDMRAKYEL